MPGEYITATHYNTETGAFGCVRTGQRESIDLEDIPYIEGRYDPNEDYIDISTAPHSPRKRPATQTTQDKPAIAAGSDDYFTLSNLPQPCRVTIGAEVYDVPDGILEWSSLLPGDYKITVTAWPYRDWEGQVTVLAGDP